MVLSKDRDVLLEQRVGEEKSSSAECLYRLSVLNLGSESKRRFIDLGHRNNFKTGGHGGWMQEVVINKLVFPTEQFKD